MDSEPIPATRQGCRSTGVVFLLAAILLLPPLLCAAVGAPPPPEQLRIDPRLEIRRWSAEPDVVDPVAIAFDAAGVAYVAECRDYPYGVGPAGKTDSWVRRLEDTDGDGKPDKVTAFAKGLSYVTSVLPWRDGILVLAPPEILFLRDTDSDGVADTREVVIRGIGRGVSDSHANALRYHLDGRVHVANGGNGGKLIASKAPGEPLDLGDDDFAFDPDTGEIELTGQGGGGFGLVSDDWGRWFTTHNINHVQQRFLSRKAVLRNPAFPAIPITGGISDHEEMAEIHPISTPETRPNHPEQAGHFSSAGGLGICFSPAFPEDMQGALFVCDVVGNLVHRDVPSADGPIFRASRAAEEMDREWLASTDPAFRPVAIETGPDGALYVLDMQRDVIEHPDYIPQRVRTNLDLRAGDDRGRIYRVTPKGGLPAARPSLRDAEPKVLLGQLGNPNRWWRLTAQRLIQERKLAVLVPDLREMVRTDGRPLARLHALWTLRALGALSTGDVGRGLADAHPGIRENALILVEDFLPAANDLQPALVRLAQDPEPRVRFQCAQALGRLGTDLAVGTLRDLYRYDSENPWTRRAVLSSLKPPDARLFLTRFLVEDGFRFAANPGRMHVLRELSEMAAVNAAARPDDFGALLGRIDATLSDETRIALLTGIEAGLRRSGAKPRVPEGARSTLNRLAAGAAPSELVAAWRVVRLLGLTPGSGFEKALAGVVRNISNPNRTPEQRATDIAVLEFGPHPVVTNILSGLLVGTEVPEVQAAAYETLVRVSPPELGPILIARWDGLLPSIRGRAAALMVQKMPLHEALLGAVEAGAIRPGELNLDLEQRRRLLREAKGAIRERAAKYWSDEEYSNRKAVVDEWIAKIPAKGDTTNGAKVFEAVCSRCHRVGDIGFQVGPALVGSAHRSVEDLLSNILDPNMAMNPQFAAYTVETTGGDSITGLLGPRNADSVVLLLSGGQTATVPRREIRTLKSSGASLMPEGLESGRTPQDLRDLIAFIRGER